MRGLPALAPEACSKSACCSLRTYCCASSSPKLQRVTTDVMAAASKAQVRDLTCWHTSYGVCAAIVGKDSVRGSIRIYKVRTGAGHPATWTPNETQWYDCADTFSVLQLARTCKQVMIPPPWGPSCDTYVRACRLTWKMRRPRAETPVVALHIVEFAAALSHTIVTLTGRSSSIARHLRVIRRSYS